MERYTESELIKHCDDRVSVLIMALTGNICAPLFLLSVQYLTSDSQKLPIIPIFIGILIIPLGILAGWSMVFGIFISIYHFFKYIIWLIVDSTESYIPSQIGEDYGHYVNTTISTPTKNKIIRNLLFSIFGLLLNPTLFFVLSAFIEPIEAIIAFFIT